jgi:hypothetical protein
MAYSDSPIKERGRAADQGVRPRVCWDADLLIEIGEKIAAGLPTAGDPKLTLQGRRTGLSLRTENIGCSRFR